MRTKRLEHERSYANASNKFGENFYERVLLIENLKFK